MNSPTKMTSEEYKRVHREIFAHPKEREGFSHSDVVGLHSTERAKIIDELLCKVEDGSEIHVEPLLWILGEDKVQFLESRNDSLDRIAHGKVFIPLVLLETTRDKQYLKQCMNATISADPEWGGRRSAIFRMYKASDGSDDFKDGCHYLVLNDKDPFMKERALRALLDALQIKTKEVDVPWPYIQILSDSKGAIARTTSKALLRNLYTPRSAPPFL